jgi:hypothetical protein
MNGISNNQRIAKASPFALSRSHIAVGTSVLYLTWPRAGEWADRGEGDIGEKKNT